MSTPFRLLLPAQLVSDMFDQAKAELPNECCGLLAGSVDAEGVGRAVGRYPLTNAAASPVEYLSDGQEMFSAIRDMRKRGIDVIAVYHSHPTSEAIPSKKDLAQNYSTEVVNLIISLKDGTPSMRGWWLTADAATEAQWTVG